MLAQQKTFGTRGQMREVHHSSGGSKVVAREVWGLQERWKGCTVLWGQLQVDVKVPQTRPQEYLRELKLHVYLPRVPPSK